MCEGVSACVCVCEKPYTEEYVQQGSRDANSAAWTDACWLFIGSRLTVAGEPWPRESCPLAAGQSQLCSVWGRAWTLSPSQAWCVLLMHPGDPSPPGLCLSPDFPAGGQVPWRAPGNVPAPVPGQVLKSAPGL